MRSLFSPIMEIYSGVSKTTSSSYIMKNTSHLSVILRNDFNHREVGYETGTGEFYAVLWVLYFSKQLCFLSTELSGI